MPGKVDPQTRNDIDFLNQLLGEELIRYPIDYETQQIGLFDLNSWFGNDTNDYGQHRFIEFGMDGSGSGYCLWYYPELKGRPPVVLFESEGDFYFIAGSTQDFIRQLTSGEIFFDGEWGEDPAADEDDGEELDFKTLRAKAEAYFGILE